MYSLRFVFAKLGRSTTPPIDALVRGPFDSMKKKQCSSDVHRLSPLLISYE